MVKGVSAEILDWVPGTRLNWNLELISRGKPILGENLHNYFDIHVCLSLRRRRRRRPSRQAPLLIFIMFRVLEAQSDRC